MNTDQSKIKNQKSKILWLIVPSLLLIAVLAFDLLPVLRGNDEWRWPLRPIAVTVRLLVPIVTLGLYVVLSAFWLRRFERPPVSRRYERWFLLFVISAAPILQFSLAFAVSRLRCWNSSARRCPFTTAVTSPPPLLRPISINCYRTSRP